MIADKVIYLNLLPKCQNFYFDIRSGSEGILHASFLFLCHVENTLFAFWYNYSNIERHKFSIILQNSHAFRSIIMHSGNSLQSADKLFERV